MLHPGEVRYRLQYDLPLILNEEANWNNRVKQTADYYLKEYMAKNLYFLETNIWNQAEPEGESNHPQGKTVTLVPVGLTYPHANYNTSDEKWFWQAPYKIIPIFKSLFNILLCRFWTDQESETIGGK